MTAGTAARYERVFASFIRYASAMNVLSVGVINEQLCQRFVYAPLPERGLPSTATSRFRLTVVRAAFNHLQALDPKFSNPTAAIRVKHVSLRLISRPLTPPEVLRLRAAARLRPKDTIRPAAVELGLAGLTHAEIAACVVDDYSSVRSGIAVGGLARRWVPLTTEGSAALARRVDAIRLQCRRRGQRPDGASAPIALHQPIASYAHTSIAPSVSSSLARALESAGLRGGVRPRSLREYAANVSYAQTGGVEAVAIGLGIASLDVARSLIDPDWQRAWGSVVRRGD